MQHGRTPRRPVLSIATATMLAAALLVSCSFAGETGAASAAHEGVSCRDCHSGSAFAVASIRQGGPGGSAVAQQCVACHEGIQPSSDGGRMFHGRTGRNCLSCHSFHEPTTIRAGEQEFSIAVGDPAVQAHCRACHQPGVRLGLIDDGHRFAAAAVYHDASRDLAGMTPSEGCLLCHDNTGTGLAVPVGVPEIPRFSTHASHPYGIRFVPGQGRGDGKIRHDIDPRLPLPDGRIECVTCHSIAAGTKDLMVPFDDPYALCLGCHRVGDDPMDRRSLALAGDQ